MVKPSLCAIGFMLLGDALAAEAPVAIAIHGGAGTIQRDSMDPEREQAIRAALDEAARAGHQILTDGGSAMDAVVAAVTRMEDSPYFNAARGAVFNAAGINEMDAAIMNGETLAAGAVGAVQRIRNPILLARAVLEHSPHVMLIGTGAEAFAAEQGLELAGRDYFFTEYRWQQLQEKRAEEGDSHSGDPAADDHYSTVGAVALDQQGRLAAATSTGGRTNKRYGRVGDTPIIGAGTYASAQCAVSATGHGEFFIRHVVAHEICARAQYTQASVADTARAVIKDELVAVGGDGGVITLDQRGQVALVFNTPGMYRASIGPDGSMKVAIYGDE